MTTEQINLAHQDNLAHQEHGLWLDLWKQLLALKAITEDDLKKPQSQQDSPGSILLATIRKWGDSLAEIRKAHEHGDLLEMLKDIERRCPTDSPLSPLGLHKVTLSGQTINTLRLAIMRAGRSL